MLLLTQNQISFLKFLNHIIDNEDKRFYTYIYRAECYTP